MSRGIGAAIFRIWCHQKQEDSGVSLSNVQSQTDGFFPAVQVAFTRGQVNVLRTNTPFESQKPRTSPLQCLTKKSPRVLHSELTSSWNLGKRSFRPCTFVAKAISELVS